MTEPAAAAPAANARREAHPSPVGHVLLVAQRNSSSGLPGYLEAGLAANGWTAEFCDARAQLLPRLSVLARSFSTNKREWFRRRERLEFYSIEAWEETSRLNGALVDARRRPDSKVLQIGGLYHPHPAFAGMEYYLFFTYTMRLAFRDQTSPWVPEPHEREAFVERERALYAHAAHIFVSADFVKRNLVEEYGVSADRVTVVGMGVNEFYLQHRPAPRAALAKRCLFVGFTWELKGGPDVLRAFARARERMPELELTIVGPPPRPEMDMPGVRALGPVRDRDALLRLYREADLFVLPSRCDSFGFVFLEAMSQGCACLGADLNAMPEIIRNGETGYVVPTGDAEAMAGAITHFFDDPARAAAMSAGAIERVHAHYTWSAVARAVVERMSASHA